MRRREGTANLCEEERMETIIKRMSLQLLLPIKWQFVRSSSMNQMYVPYVFIPLFHPLHRETSVLELAEEQPYRRRFLKQRKEENE